jgi:hypothetical protein
MPEHTIAPDTVPVTTEGGDHERFAHYVYAPNGNAAAIVTEALVTGTPVQALCGKVWVPSRDPRRFPVCPECDEIAKGLRSRPSN